MTKKILITGCAGAIAANFIRKVYFDKLPYQLVGIDNLSSKHSANNVFLNKNFRMHIGSILDKDFFEKILELEQPDIILHLARNQWQDSDEINFIYNIYHQLSINTSVKKIIYISGNHYINDNSKENYLIAPKDFCDVGQIASEQLIQNFGLPFLIFRPADVVFGIRQYYNHDMFPCTVRQFLQNNSEIVVPNFSNLLWVEDLISAITMCLEKNIENKIFNIDSDYLIEPSHFCKQMAVTLNLPLKSFSFAEIQKPKVVKSIDCSALKDIGWIPSDNDNYKKIIQSVIRWYDSNRWSLSLK